MSSYTLADIQRAADKKYGNTEIPLEDGEIVVLLNPLRLPKAKRLKLTKMFRNDEIAARLEDEPELDIYDLHREAIQLACQSEASFEKLDQAIGDSAAEWALIFGEYNGVSELGEASTSES